MRIGSSVPLRSIVVIRHTAHKLETHVKKGGNDQMAGYLNPDDEVTLLSGADASALDAVLLDCSCDAN